MSEGKKFYIADRCIWRYTDTKDFQKGFIWGPRNGLVCIEDNPHAEHRNFYILDELQVLTLEDMP